MFVPKGSGTLAIFMRSWMDSENIHTLLDNFWPVFSASIHALIEALSTQRLLPYTVVKVGSGI